MKKLALRSLFLALAAAVALGTGPLLAQSDFAFMPDGGRQILLGLTGASIVELKEIATSSHGEAEWAKLVAPWEPSLTVDEMETLVSYLAINMPLPTEKVEKAETIEQLQAVLPLDGKELAIENCQFCHSFFTGYLAHDRDFEGWHSIFKAPFHKELPMSEKERQTFARYSAINMPIPYDKVPEELRF